MQIEHDAINERVNRETMRATMLAEQTTEFKNFAFGNAALNPAVNPASIAMFPKGINLPQSFRLKSAPVNPPRDHAHRSSSHEKKQKRPSKSNLSKYFSTKFMRSNNSSQASSLAAPSMLFSSERSADSYCSPVSKPARPHKSSDMSDLSLGDIEERQTEIDEMKMLADRGRTVSLASYQHSKSAEMKSTTSQNPVVAAVRQATVDASPTPSRRSSASVLAQKIRMSLSSFKSKQEAPKEELNVEPTEEDNMEEEWDEPGEMPEGGAEKKAAATRDSALESFEIESSDDSRPTSKRNDDSGGGSRPSSNRMSLAAPPDPDVSNLI